MKLVDELFQGLTVFQIEQFKSDVFWRIAELTIKERIETIRSILEVGEVSYKDGDTVNSRPATYDELKGLQGECKSLRWLLLLPEIFMEQKVQEAKLKEQKEEKEAESC